MANNVLIISSDDEGNGSAPCPRPKTNTDGSKRRRVTDVLDIDTSTIEVRVYKSIDDDSKLAKTYVIHAKPACAASPFIAAAMRKEWAEGNTAILKLHDTTASAFDVFTQWLYCNSVSERLRSDCHEIDFVNSYILGDMLLCTDFQDAVMDSYLDMLVSRRYLPSAKRIGYVWLRSSQKCPLRKLFLDSFVGSRGHHYMEERHRKSLPADFLWDAWKMMEVKAKTSRTTGFPYLKPKRWVVLEGNLDRCKYHKHTMENKPCYKALQ